MFSELKSLQGENAVFRSLANIYFSIEPIDQENLNQKLFFAPKSFELTFFPECQIYIETESPYTPKNKAKKENKTFF